MTMKPLLPSMRLALFFFALAHTFTFAEETQKNEVSRAKSVMQGTGKIVFLGDSITQAGDFIVDVQCWLFSHGIGNHIINLGLGSETATDLTAEENAGHLQAYQFARPAIKERLSRVLTLTKPDVLFVCYGMNDAGAIPANDSGFTRFAEAITALRNEALKSGVRKVVVCTPPVHDNKGDVAKSFHDANLTRYTAWLLSKRDDGWDVIDFHTPMRQALDDGRAANPAFALATDGTHPERDGHWIMAKQILQSFFGAEQISAGRAEDLFASHGAEVRTRVRDLTDLRFHHWMLQIGHNRPGVIGGPDQKGQTDPAAFESQQSACLRDIHALWRRAEAASTMARLEIGSPEVIYTDDRIPYTMDASWATLRQPDGTTTFFHTAMGHKPYYFRHAGTPDNPLQTELPAYSFDYSGHNHTWPSGCWLPNIYQHSDGSLIGFCHREDLYPSNGRNDGGQNFFIGLAKSTNGGSHWTYLGDVITTRGNGATNPAFANLGGVPYLIVDGYVYVYFNEHDGPTASDHRYLSVARASLSDVTSATTSRKPRFQKFRDGRWTEDGMTGLGSEIIPDSRFRNDSSNAFDFHSDAAYCKPLGRYLITVQTHSDNTLKLYSSADGLHWLFEKNLDTSPGCMHPYSSIVGFGNDSTPDSHVVGNTFYIYFPRKGFTDYNAETLCRIKCTIHP